MFIEHVQEDKDVLYHLSSIVTLPECNKAIANYLFIEYQCLPTPAIASHNVDLCSSQIDRSLLVLVEYYKVHLIHLYTQTQCANVSLSSFGRFRSCYLYVFT